MRQSKSGMQSAAVHATLICPKCHKPAFRRVDQIDGSKEYWHFTKKGHVVHIQHIDVTFTSRRKSYENITPAQQATRTWLGEVEDDN